MDRPLKYRVADSGELPLIRDMLRAAANRLQQMKVDQWAYWLDPPEDKIDWLEQGVAEGEYNFACIEEEVVAMYRLSSEDLIYWGPQIQAALYIHSLVVLPAYTGNGIGVEIIKTVEAEAIERNIQTLRLDCHACNRRLCQYYEDQGFCKVGEKLMPHSLNNLYEKTLTD